MFQIITNDRAGNWAFGVSKSGDLRQVLLHFAVWHLVINY